MSADGVNRQTTARHRLIAAMETRADELDSLDVGVPDSVRRLRRKAKASLRAAAKALRELESVHG